ncbi:MAG: tRNA lysidine(34) synthetase TilS [Clostridiales bacterium]|jgi:tRNA(Ile)-lysidine synthase|nr:tRNA lysidine(34) synthetase TilS [Clostridiales bacterium]
MEEVIKKILSDIKRYGMLCGGENVIVGLSGGADSVFLVSALLRIRDILKLNLSAVHINHSLRGEESLRDENFVVDLCKRLEIPVKVCTFDVNNEAVKLGLTVEEAGRKIRYETFNDEALSAGGAKIAVAHNKNDSAETVILNLCRGSGLLGAAGIAPVRGNIIRPLINICRSEIELYLNENDIPYVTDSSNSSLKYARNAVRNVVMPALERHVNSSVLENIIRFADIARADDTFLESLAREGLKECYRGGGVVIEKLLEYHEVMQRRIIREWLKNEGDNSLKNIAEGHIGGILSLLNSVSGKETVLPGGVIIRREFGKIKIANEKMGQDFFYHLHYNSKTFVAQSGLSVYVSDLPTEGGRLLYIQNGNGASKNLCVRNRREGDSIYFSGVGGRKKLKDLFIEKKVPLSQRSKVPIIAAGSEVLWLRVLGKDIFAQEPPGISLENYEKIYVRIQEVYKNEGNC